MKKPSVHKIILFTLVLFAGVWLCPRPCAGEDWETLISETVVERDISYGPHRLNKLDLYMWTGGKDQTRPVMVFIHGGGWRGGNKMNVRAKPYRFVHEGYLFVSINYRLSPEVQHPEHALDVARALAWVHENIRDYGGDPDRMYIMGHSAGGHLAAIVATDESLLGTYGLDLTAIKGVVLLEGAAYDIPLQIPDADPKLKDMCLETFGDDEQAWKDASPVNHIEPDKGIPPFLAIHAGNNKSSRRQAEKLVEVLHDADVPATISHAPNKGHVSLNRALGLFKDIPTKVVLDFLKNLNEE